MTISSIEAFVPSGKNFEGSKQFFQEIGFIMTWDTGGYAGFEKDGCKFILQDYDQQAFAENLMLSVKIDDAQAFWEDVNSKNLVAKYGIRISKPTQQPYGLEVNVIDLAGVCWHFVE